ncbi:MAG: DoxX family protein [Planctomycetes bacterium]|nr:DoxX family protein [Planctomycetota bacterium]
MIQKLAPSRTTAPRVITAIGRRLLATPPDWAAFTVRLVLGGVMFPHAAQKAFGWFGGYGFSATMTSFQEQLGIPAVLAFLEIITEFLASVGLIAGFLGRLSALAVAIIMLVAIGLVHAPNGFFMNWFGTQPGEGFEYHLLALAMTIALMIRGSGAFSVDRAISRA